jgi:hypothetical protein
MNMADITTSRNKPGTARLATPDGEDRVDLEKRERALPEHNSTKVTETNTSTYIHEFYTRFISKLVLSEVQVKNDLIQEYLTEKDPFKCLLKGPHEDFTVDDRRLMRRFNIYTDLPKRVVILEPTWKFYHAISLQVADELKLGMVDMRWLITKQDEIRRKGLTRPQFIQEARRWHEARNKLEDFNVAVLFQIVLQHGDGPHRYSKAIWHEYRAKTLARDMEIDDLVQPGNKESLAQFLESYSHRNSIPATNVRGM